MSYPNPPEPPPGGNYPPPGFPPGGPGGYPPPGGGPMGPPPDNNLVWAILSTIFCCLPFGIVAIVKASKVQGLWFSGQYGEAQQAAADAKKFSIIAAGAGAVVAVLYVIFVLVLAGASMSSY